MKNTGIVIASLIGGMVVGSALALLFAPQSGTETRKQIKDLVDDGIDKAKQAAGNLKSQLKDSAGELKERISEHKSQMM